MTKLLRNLTPWSQAMLAGILVLAGLIVLEAAILDFNAATATLAGEGETETGAKAAGTGSGLKVVSIPPLPTYRELLARPLFMQTRRPAPRQASGGATQRVDPNTKWKLTGVIVAGEDSHVFVQGIRDATIRRLVAGQVLDGWVISEIAPGYVTLTSGGQESTLELRKDTGE
jgi:hypothetical protein